MKSPAQFNRRRFLQQVGASIAVGATMTSLPACATSKLVTKSGRLAREITRLSGLELSSAIRSREFSCKEVMQAYLDQIEILNPVYNAIVSLGDRDALIKQASRYDDELSAGKYRGWMHGFPFSIKDLADAKGYLSSYGSPIFRNNIATKDSIHVERIRNAGAIIIGKTNVPEFGLGSHTYNPVFGPSLNPYDAKSSVGGSSGGAAASLALQTSPVADGSDLMGSLRNPGAFNNVIGFRPTPGLVPLSRSYKEELPCNGPMGRNVADTAMLLSTMAGFDPRSPSSLNSDPREFTRPLQRDFTDVRIGWLGNYDGYLAMEDGVLSLCEDAMKNFETVGCRVEAVKLDFSMEELWQTWLTFRHWLVRARGLALYEDPKKRPLLKPEYVWEVEGGAKLSGDDVSRASSARARWYAALEKAFAKYDYLVLPTAQVFPFDAQMHWPKEIAGKQMDTYHRWMEVVIGGTLSGCPVANVPAGFGKRGLPMGLQIIARRYQDFSCLQMAYAYEQAARWNLDRVPPVLS